MTKEDVTTNLDYLKTVAEQGIKSPLLGGRIGLMWSALLIPTLCLHGLAGSGVLPKLADKIGTVWLAYGAIGVLLSVALGQKLRGKPGAGSTGNRIESIVWRITVVLIFTFVVSIALAVGLGHAPLIFFNMIMPFAFGLAAANLWLLGQVTEQAYLKSSGVLSLVFMMLTIIFIAHPAVYFLAAAGVFLTGVMPNILQLKKEPDYVA